MPLGISEHSESMPGRNEGVLIDLLIGAADRCADSGVHLVDQSGEGSMFLSYPAILQAARRIAGGLRSRNVTPGSKIVLLLERPGEVIPAFWGCVLGGYVPCPATFVRGDPQRASKHWSHIDTLLEHPFVICKGNHSERPPGMAVFDLEALSAGNLEVDEYDVRLSDLALLMLTSGSTGNAKAVKLTHANLMASMAGKAEKLALRASDIALNWIAFDHVAALLEIHMIAQYVGATQVHAEPETVLTNPLMFLHLIDRHRVSLAFAPNFLLGQIAAAMTSKLERGNDATIGSLDLSCVRHIVTGGEANVVETGRRFLNLLSPYGLSQTALKPAFGMTETSAAAVYSDDFPKCDEGREFAAVGDPIVGFDIRIADGEGSCTSEGTPGELEVSGPMVFGGYLGNEEVTRAAFTKDGWFRTGDLARMENGRLRLSGRTKDCVIVNGVNYFSHELESALESLDGIARSYVAAFSTRPAGADTEQLVIAFGVERDSTEERKLYQLLVGIRNSTLLLWGFRPAQILPLPKSAFPKTSLGKIQRSLMRQRLEAGDYNIYANHVAAILTRQLGEYTPPAGPNEFAIAEMFSDVLGIDAVGATANFFDLGGTSLEVLKLTHLLSRHFERKVDFPIVLQHSTVRDLAQRIDMLMHGGEHTYDPIIPLQKTGSKIPLFCVHPGDGGVLTFVNLAKYFVNERPFYALQARGFSPDDGIFGSFEELIETYLEAIRVRQKHGPYALAGYSVGCPISFEIAKRLEARGEKVGFLGLIDEGPSEDWPPVSRAGAAVTLGLMLNLLNNKQAVALERQFRAEPAQNPFEVVFRAAQHARCLELDLDLKKFSVWADITHSIHDLVRAAHVTNGAVESITVFCSAGWPSQLPVELWRKQLRRWERFSRRTVKFIDVAGEHLEIMGPKHVPGLQSVLISELDRALEGQ